MSSTRTRPAVQRSRARNKARRAPSQKGGGNTRRAKRAAPSDDGCRMGTSSPADESLSGQPEGVSPIWGPTWLEEPTRTLAARRRLQGDTSCGRPPVHHRCPMSLRQTLAARVPPTPAGGVGCGDSTVTERLSGLAQEFARLGFRPGSRVLVRSNGAVVGWSSLAPATRRAPSITVAILLANAWGAVVGTRYKAATELSSEGAGSPVPPVVDALRSIGAGHPFQARTRPLMRPIDRSVRVKGPLCKEIPPAGAFRATLVFATGCSNQRVGQEADAQHFEASHLDDDRFCDCPKSDGDRRPRIVGVEPGIIPPT